MASRFTGRDYTTLRQEIIEFLRQKLPNNWDYTNLADPVVIFAESLARVGDQLHFTIDELRRECDVATARRASSIYSYATREGYKMMLPRGSFGTITLNSKQEYGNHLSFHIKKFDALYVSNTEDTLYSMSDIPGENIEADTVDLYPPIDKSYVEVLSQYYILDDNGNPVYDTDIGKRIDLDKRSNYARYVSSVYEKTQHIDVVLGSMASVNFSIGDINNDATYDLPEPVIDRNLIRLQWWPDSAAVQGDNGIPLDYVDDVISSGFKDNTFTLTPKFIGGIITLSIELPSNYRDLFGNNAVFRFDYIKISDRKIENTNENIQSIDWSEYVSLKDGYELSETDADINDAIIVDLGNGIKGYIEYESAYVTRDNYKNFVQDYSALLTKENYTNYIKSTSSAHCKVYDHDDNYREENGLPPGTNLMPRVLYILTDDNYSAREVLWEDLKERSSRSDCIVMIPYGKDPYSIVIKADCYLLGTASADVSTAIKSSILQAYGDILGEKIPESSMINYLVHKASDKVIRTESVVVRDSTFGTLNTDFADVNNLSNDDIDALYNAIVNGTISNDPNDTSVSSKYLRGKVSGTIELSPGNTTEAVLYYNKYPRILGDGSGRNLPDNQYTEYRSYPRKFPDIYNFELEKVCSSYDELVEDQVVYGVFDTPAIDYNDDEIFKPSTSGYRSGLLNDNSESTAGEYYSEEFETTPIHGLTNVYIDSNYIDHHYMTPCLNRVIILIKAITR